MQRLDGRLVHSASDLNAFSECVHLTALDRAAALGELVRPDRKDPTAELLARKGDEHEQRHLERLRASYGERLVAFSERPAHSRAAYETAEAQTLAAMARGVEIIYQATFFDGTFLGYADFLRRIERPSAHWDWSYEAVDTKLALSVKPYFLVQLCNYSEHLARLQGMPPEYAAIVLGSGEERRFRVDDYAAYYRQLKAAYLASVERGDDAYPFECAHCDGCVWSAACAKRRDDDDHLSIVANIRRDQIAKLEGAGVTTLAALATADDDDCPKQLARDTYLNLRSQAAEQQRYRLAARSGNGATPHSYTFRPAGGERTGLARLPAPAAGDVFFDIEGDPLYRPGRGLEYLFGAYLPDEDEYRAFWGRTPAEEREAFESFVDFVVERQRRYPDLHVYHYSSYETSALKRLMGRFASREIEIDRFLIADTFVDLYPVVRQSVWISQPSYSIKKVEALYGWRRTTQTRGGDDSIVMFESWLEDQNPATLEDIRAYNEDDCRSTHALREWLAGLRAEFNAQSASPIPWRAAPEGREPPQSPERSELAKALLEGIPAPDSLDDLRAWAEPLRGRWLLGNLLEYHRREQKPDWWQHFYRIDHPSELAHPDRHALGGLTLREDVEAYKRSERDRTFVYTYAYPEQEHDFDAGNDACDGDSGKNAGSIVSCDDLTGTLEIKLAQAIVPEALRAIIPRRPLDDKQKRLAVEAIATAYRDGTLETTHPATLAMLLERSPRVAGRPYGARLQPDTVTSAAVSSVVRALDRSYLVIQGPPGSGKTTTAAQTIVDLIKAGKRVALAAFTHKALHNLLHRVERCATERGVRFKGCHKSAATNAGSPFESHLDESLVADAPHAGAFAGCALVSATTYAWADEGQRSQFDVVVIDEAGQVSLADALVTSLVAENVVLLGDPQQLPQVGRGSHPVGTDGSILEHLLGGQPTIAANRGIFLDTTYRLHPDVDRFVSRAFYENRLKADALNARNRVDGGGLSGGGPRWLAVRHEGNARKSVEEADCIVEAIARLLEGGTVTVRDAPPRPLTERDILVVAPYNRQRAEIGARLRGLGFEHVRVGTVDKFQGQEAPVVFYSMATSDAELAPRGLEFLLSPNRLNVAVSRAQALSVLVCSPNLPAARAATVEEMELLNLLCSYVETVGG